MRSAFNFHAQKVRRIAFMSFFSASATVLATSVSAIPIINPSNGHYYDFVPKGSSLLTWGQAQVDATSSTYIGMEGYLATVTSEVEQSFIESILDGVAFNNLDNIALGGSDSAQEGVWRWVFGPEAALQFWQGDTSGFQIGGAYNHWEALNGTVRQPDNGGGNEHFLAIEINNVPGRWPSDEKYMWNDVDSGRLLSGYIVEYSAVPEPSTLFLIGISLAVQAVNSMRKL